MMRRIAFALLAVCGLTAGAATANAGDQVFRTASLNNASAAVSTVAYRPYGRSYGGYRGGYYGGYRGGYYNRGYGYYPRYNYGYRGYSPYRYYGYGRPSIGFGFSIGSGFYPGNYGGYRGFGYSPYYW